MTDNPEQTQAQAVKETIPLLLGTIAFALMTKTALESDASLIIKLLFFADQVAVLACLLTTIVDLIEAIHRRSR